MFLLNILKMNAWKLTIKGLDPVVGLDLGANCLQSYQQTTIVGKELTVIAR